MKMVRWMWMALSAVTFLSAQSLPSELKEWRDWVTWEDKLKEAPVKYNDPATPLPIWPREFNLSIDAKHGSFNLEIKVFAESWFALPGNLEIWPQQVKSKDRSLPVVEHQGRPAIKLLPGNYQLTGEYRWAEIPQKIEVPNSIGILNLKIDGKSVENPNWEQGGDLWLRRAKVESSDQNEMTTQVYRLLEDGIPMWLRTEVEVTVSGKSREEGIGFVMPEGWKIATIQSPIPVMIDEKGLLKAQVRSGKWNIKVEAYRTSPLTEFGYSKEIKSAVGSEWIAFKANPELRVLDLQGIDQIDVTQTSFPSQWRSWPVYQWNTEKGFKLEEKMRGMGEERRGDWTLNRELWLDENGAAFTFRDKLAANDQTIWRLNSSAHQKLGSVKLNQLPQLITRHPISGQEGVEIRFSKSYQIEAVGKSDSARKLDVAGWDQEMKQVNATVHLPPGWKMIGTYGAESVTGDWISQWTLWDFFFWLLMTLSVFRLWGVSYAVMIGLALGLTIQEPNAPKYIWMALILPLGLMKVMVRQEAQKILKVVVGIVFLALAYRLIDFGVQQIRISIYPQLENEIVQFQESSFESSSALLGVESLSPTPASQSKMEMNLMGDAEFADRAYKSKIRGRSSSWGASEGGAGSGASRSNLLQKTDAKVQTGLGIPEWNHCSVRLTWNSPVTPQERIQLWMTPPWLTGLLRLIGLALAAACAVRLIDLKTVREEIEERLKSSLKLSKISMVAILLIGSLGLTRADTPAKEVLEQLRQRLLKKSDAFPSAASISMLTIKVEGNQLLMEAEVHAAVESAIPLPGRLPLWSPLSVNIGTQPASAILRDQGSLWVLVPEGVSRVTVRGLIPNSSEWEFPFALKPKQVTVIAPDWEVKGVRPGEIPEAQLFFAKKQKNVAQEGAFQNQSDLGSVVLVYRELEIGLIWKVVTHVERRWGGNKAVSITVPLLSGEKILTNGVLNEKGVVQVRLGTNERAFSWESELDPVNDLNLVSSAGEGWVEQWLLSVSPVWSVESSGLPPFFDRERTDLTALWRPWSGEKVTLKISRPEAISGETCTVHRVQQSTQWGKSQSEKTLNMDLQSSLGGDFKITGWKESQKIDSLMVGGVRTPVRREGENLMIPLKPGEQKIELHWRENQGVGFWNQESGFQFPVPVSNIRIDWSIPQDRVLLWTWGPRKGPAVLIWAMLLCSIIVALGLGRLKGSPLSWKEWGILLLGFLQTSLILSFAVIFWFMVTAYRSKIIDEKTRPWIYNLFQLGFLGLILLVLSGFAAVISEGLLQIPNFSVSGNGSNMLSLNWYEAFSEKEMPSTGAITIPIWIYRGLMLAWSIWIAQSLIRWLGWIWKSWNEGGLWKRGPKVAQPPVIPRNN